jgi:hypothetical protein
MWTRDLLQCKLCGKVTNLRLEITGPPRQEIRFQCLGCGATIGGILIIDYEKIETSFEPINCIRIKGDLLTEGDHFVEYSSARPVAKPSKKPYHPLTPRLRQFPESEAARDLIARAKWSQSISDEDWFNFNSLNVAYIEQNYSTFRTIVKKYLPNDFPLKKRIDLQAAFYQLHYLFLGPYIPLEKNNALVSQMVEYIHDKNEPFMSEMKIFVDYLFMNDYLQNWQRDITYILNNIADNREWFSYFAVHLLTSKKSQDYWLPTEQYPLAKRLYTDMFEVMGRMLLLIIGLNNIEYRRNYQNFPGNIPKSVQSFEAFSELSNATKFKYCQENPLWIYIFNNTFDHKLRNGINHNKAYFEESSQIISYFPDTAGKKCYQINYYDFMVHTVNTFWALFDLHQLVKILLVRYYLSSSDSYQLEIA